MTQGAPLGRDMEAGQLDGHASARAAGEVVADKYVLVRYIAGGGMSEVWLGTHQALRTPVAIKFVDPRLARDRAQWEQALERFRFEAQISARLSARTRNIVAVHDAGMHAGVPYLVMEYVVGRTLDAEVTEAGPLSPERFADVLDQVADALAAAHALGILHRDLKPSNLLLCEPAAPGEKQLVKVADFGVAKAVDTTLAVDRPRDTQRGEIVGSPAFMSPEQLRDAASADGRSDVWSLGVVAYEALTGRAPFEGKNMMDTFAAISIGRYPPPSSVRPELPRALDAWFTRALALEPTERFASPQEMAKAYRTMIAGAASRRPIVIAALIASAALLAAVAGFVLLRGDARPAAAVATAAPAPPPPAPATATAAAVAALPSATALTVGGDPPHPPAQPVEKPSAVPARPQAPRASINVPATPRPTAPPVAAQPPPAPKPARPSKAIDPSEIQ